MPNRMPKNDTSAFEKIAQDFGANASYVETLFDRYQSSPSLVDESWSEYFEGLLGRASTNGKHIINGEAPAKIEKEAVSPARPTKPAAPKPENAELLRGAAKKIVENMEQSLTVPTASSIRLVPVKLLDE